MTMAPAQLDTEDAVSASGEARPTCRLAHFRAVPSHATLNRVTAIDQDLVISAGQGDREAFAALVERTWARLVSLARSIVGDSEAEDVVQEGLIVAWRKLRGLRDPGAFAPWMMRIVSRSAVRRARQGWRMTPLAAVAEPIDVRATREVHAIDVERTLAVLAPRQRAVMFLTVIEGMSDSEIASILGVTAASVRSHRRRARHRLRQVLGEPPPERTGGLPDALTPTG